VTRLSAPAEPRRTTTKGRQPRISEKQEQQAIVDLLRLIGAKVYVLGTRRPRTESYHGTCQTPGLPDIYAILPTMGVKQWRHAMWIEVKRQGGRTRPEQLEFEEHTRDIGIAYFRGTADGFTAYLRSLGFRIG
jgi:hypothetical protein